MKPFVDSLIFLGYYCLIGYACWLSESAWPLSIMLFSYPSIKYNGDKTGEDIACKCTSDERTGETSVMCCNVCGKPTEEFWTSHKK